MDNQLTELSEAKKPFFSIVTACKDQLEYLKETVQSLLSQTFENWEWIVFDDASAEDVSGYLKSLNDPRIKVFRNQTCLKQTRSLNLAIQKSSADWIVRIDADDLAYPSRLEKTHETILRDLKAREGQISPLVFSDYDVVCEDGSFLTSVRYQSPPNDYFYKYLKNQNNLLCHPAVSFYKKQPSGVLYQYDETLKNAQDYALWKKILADYGSNFLHISEPLIRYRLVKSSLSGARIAEQLEELKAIRKGKTELIAKEKQALNLREQQGMYAYRKLYYGFIGVSERSKPNLHTLVDAAKYPRVLSKSVFFYSLWSVRQKLKPILFRQVYK